MAAGADSDDEVIEDEDSTQKLESFDKFGRAFVRTLTIMVEDVGANESHRQRFLEVLAECFTNVIRLSNSLTGGQGAVTALCNSFVAEVGTKASQIGESVAQQENFQEDRQEVIDAAGKEQTKRLMEEAVAIYAEKLAAWREAAECQKSVPAARALIELALKLRSATKEVLSQNA